MKPGTIVVVAFFLLICLWPGQAPAEQEKENHITGLILDLPPFFLTDGPDKGSGFADRIQEMAPERLSGRQHRADPATVWTEIISGRMDHEGTGNAFENGGRWFENAGAGHEYHCR